LMNLEDHKFPDCWSLSGRMGPDIGYCVHLQTPLRQW
jgi:hypothetical protein